MADPYSGVKKQFRVDLVNENSSFLDDKLYLEFGVMNGNSLIDFYDAYDNKKIKGHFYGFDSFSGLPEEKNDKNSPWRTGQFSVGGKIPFSLTANPDMNIVDGWFSDTLNDSLLEKFGDKKIGIAHIDCDIYTSTIQVLEFIVKNNLLCEGSILLYDDWGAYRQAGLTQDQSYEVAEAKAHKEIVEKYNLNFELVGKKVIDPKFYELATFKYRG